MSSDDRPNPRRRVFIGKYDPATRPFPSKLVGSGASAGPIGNSRNQRRQRAKLSFAEQLALAKSVGFPVPDFTTAKNQQTWIDGWEARYAKR